MFDGKGWSFLTGSGVHNIDFVPIVFGFGSEFLRRWLDFFFFFHTESYLDMEMISTLDLFLDLDLHPVFNVKSESGSRYPYFSFKNFHVSVKFFIYVLYFI